MEKRNYRLGKRAEGQRETRERIVDAAVGRHEEIGPAATTIVALAERAGVQRLTVYRHFASEREIFQACSAKWLGRHPPPDLAVHPPGPPEQRIRSILRALYGYYGQTQGMWRSLYRDLGKVESLAESMRPFENHLAAAGDALVAACTPARSMRLRATATHAVRFSTWQSLDGQGLGAGAMAELVGDWIRAAAR